MLTCDSRIGGCSGAIDRQSRESEPLRRDIFDRGDDHVRIRSLLDEARSSECEHVRGDRRGDEPGQHDDFGGGGRLLDLG